MADDGPHQLVVARARLRGRDGLWWLGVDDGLIAVITPQPLTGETFVDAEECLVTESFVDAHLHLEKAYTLDMLGDDAIAAYTTRGMGAAMTGVEVASKVKQRYAEPWLYNHARRAALDGLRHGVTHVQAFVDTDTNAQLEGVRAALRVRDELQHVMRIDVVAFPQEGLHRDPGAEQLVTDAVALGCDVVGGIPWLELTDAEAHDHVRRMVSLAAASSKRVAMLVDDAGDASLRTTEMLASEMLATGLRGRGVACHARAMALYPEPSFLRVAGLARRAGLGFVSDPHTGPLHLPVFDLRDRGVPVAIGQDDIEDAFYPFGRHNMLEVAYLAAHLLDARTRPHLEALYDMVTTDAARVLGDDQHRLRVGARADLVVLAESDVPHALLTHAAPRYVVSRGRVVATSTSTAELNEQPAP